MLGYYKNLRVSLSASFVLCIQWMVSSLLNHVICRFSKYFLPFPFLRYSLEYIGKPSDIQGQKIQVFSSLRLEYEAFLFRVSFPALIAFQAFVKSFFLIHLLKK